ncbi:MAG: hypothetical protein JXR91_11685 [Deltaproteobacteria bacterium]|nr:hypothetical protein [Deltaproteobacteria bacterium]
MVKKYLNLFNFTSLFIIANIQILSSCTNNDTTVKKDNVPNKIVQKIEENPGNDIIAKTAKVNSKAIHKPEQLQLNENIQKENNLKKLIVSDLKVVSKRSCSLKIYDEDGNKAIFKPYLKVNTTAKHEVAYYKIAHILDVKRVPVSVIGLLPLSKIKGFLSKKYPEFIDEFLKRVEFDSDNLIKGAFIEWIDNIEPLSKEKNDYISTIEILKSNDTQLQQSAYRMIVLDYILGNWDRFSGGNLFKIKDTNTLALIDQNNAFSSLSEGQEEKLNRYINLVKTVPPDLLSKIKLLNKSKIKDAVMIEENNTPLLSDAEIAQIMSRIELLQNR